MPGSPEKLLFSAGLRAWHAGLAAEDAQGTGTEMMWRSSPSGELGQGVMSLSGHGLYRHVFRDGISLTCESQNTNLGSHRVVKLPGQVLLGKKVSGF